MGDLEMEDIVEIAQCTRERGGTGGDRVGGLALFAPDPVPIFSPLPPPLPDLPLPIHSNSSGAYQPWRPGIIGCLADVTAGLVEGLERPRVVWTGRGEGVVALDEGDVSRESGCSNPMMRCYGEWEHSP